MYEETRTGTELMDSNGILTESSTTVPLLKVRNCGSVPTSAILIIVNAMNGNENYVVGSLLYEESVPYSFE